MTNTDNATRTGPQRAGVFWLGTIGLLVSLGASIVLSGDHLNLLHAPGGGGDSACARASASVWGKIPWLAWPLAFVGLAYFAAMAGAWASALKQGVLGAPVRMTARVGGVISLALIGVMINGGYLCLYCLAVHLGNFAFLAAVELTPRAQSRRTGLAWAAVAFGVVTLVEIGVFASAQGKIAKQLEKSTQDIIAAGGQGGADNGSTFTGRYRVGPEKAVVRLVIFSDYQCPECRMIEAQVREIVAERSDVSFSAKHFPMCSDCNPRAVTNPHRNACWAARAAETAGILRGGEAFFEMHRWLFGRGGSFTRSELEVGLREMGYDLNEFLSTMQGPETLARVQADIQEALGFGLHFTPMVFVNGVELKGWNVPNAIRRAVEGVAAAGLPAMTAAGDQPVSADRKFVEDWLQAVNGLLGESRWLDGDAGAPIQVVIWGDYQEPFTAEADRCLRALFESRGDISYSFRHYPFHRACNRLAKSDRHPKACLAHRAAEAAGTLGGNEAYWAMHEWLMTHQDELSEETLRATAAAIGLDANQLITVMSSPEIDTVINADARRGTHLGLRSIPLVFVNNRALPRWRLEGRCMIEDIVELAAQERTP